MGKKVKSKSTSIMRNVSLFEKRSYYISSAFLVVIAYSIVKHLDYQAPLNSELPDEEKGRTQSPLSFKRRGSFLELMKPNSSNIKEFAIEPEFLPKSIPAVKFMEGPPMRERRERAMGAKFRNFYRFPLTIWWDDGSEQGVYSGLIKPLGHSATNTYTTHVFKFRNKDSGEIVTSVTMNDNEHLIILGPDPSDEETLNSVKYKESLNEQKFIKQYYEENGIPWLSYYPRNKPELFLYPADFIGQTHRVVSNVGYFYNKTVQSMEPINFEIKVVSTRPRVFIIENLLNQFEVNHIMELGKNVVRRSSVGNAENGFHSDTRTSENGWLPRKSSSILDMLYYRFADVLRMTDKQMTDSPHGSIENLQFVRYLPSQRYDAHHDFGSNGYPEQRFSTMLIYLKVPEIGGATSFPKAFDGQGIMIKPRPGDAVLFYSMLPDGNADDLSLHAGMPVENGTKYICNLWSWDPRKR